MSTSSLPLYPSDDGWPYPDGALEHDTVDPVDDDLDELELRVDPHAFDGLTTLERAVLTRRFGLDGRAPATMKELGPALGCSRTSARDALGCAIEKLRHRLLAT